MRAARGTMPARSRGQRGAAAVEFALVMIPLIALLLGSIQFGFYFFTAQSASSAARETARRLVVGDCDDATSNTALAKTYAENQANVMNLQLQYGSQGVGEDEVAGNGELPAVGQVLRVKVVADSDILQFFPLPETVTRVVNARVEDDVASGAC